MSNTPFIDRTFWLYPWDIDDGRPEDRLREISRLGATAISVPFSYHSLRALAPHRTGKKIINALAAIYFRPRPGEFSTPGTQPLCSELATEDGPVANLSALAGKVGLKVRAWTVLFHNTPLASAHPDSAIANCFGELLAHALSPAAPKAREYAMQLVRAICARRIHAIELEAAGFYGYEHASIHDKCDIAFDLFHHFLFSCCFCTHCCHAFSSAGLDPAFIVETFRHRLLQFFDGKAPAINNAKEAADELNELLGEEVAAGIVLVRCRCLMSLLQELRSLAPPGIEFTVMSALSSFECGALFGAQPKDTLRIVDRLLLTVFDPDEDSFRRRFENALECLPDPAMWIVGMRIFPPVYHYGLAPRHLLGVAARCWQCSDQRA